MKKLLQSYFTLSLLFFGNWLFGQNMDFTIKFNTYTSEYEVYARPDFSESTFFVSAGSQLSIAVPASVTDAPFVVTSVTGGPWSDNSRVFAPGAAPNHDFHSIASDGLTLVNFANGIEELLFTFKLPLGGCVEGIRLFENATDPQDMDTGMFGTDFNNFFGDGLMLFSDFYRANYNNTGTICSDPMLVPIPLTVEMDSSGIVCMNVLDANPLDSFTVSTCGAANGTPAVTITGDLVCVDYQPNGNYVGTDTVCVIVCDQTGNCDKTVVPITVVPPLLVTTVPEPPVVYPSPITVPADSTIALCVPVLDPNVGSTFTPTLCGVPNGTATPTINNSKLCLTFTPDAGFSGDTEICVIVCDQTGLCDTVTFPVNVFPLPVQADSSQAPIVTLPAIVTPEDTPVSTCGPIADANTTDTYTAMICATPANVTAMASIDNSNNQVCINVSPNLHFNGHDVVCVVVCDQNNVCDTIHVPVTVTPVNDKPIAVLDRDTTDEDVLIVFDVQGNDIEIDNDPLTTTVIGNSTQGSMPTVVNDSISYLPPLNFYGTDTITYQICDNGTPQLCDTALAIIQVGPINDVPVAMSDTTDVNEDEYVIIMVQMDDEDVDMDDLTTRVIVAPTHGTYSIIAMDSIEYRADTNYTGMDMLVYEICDNGLAPQLCDTATVYINVIPVNDKPIALNDSAIVTMNINNNIFPVEINDSDVEDSLLYLTPISSTRGATLSAVDDTLLRYDPPLNYSGYDTVLYQICDHDTPNLCDTATVIVYVKPDGDNDGIADVDDLDDDNDGIPDAIEGYGDADGDGIPNNLDLDSDNDGIQDILEAGGADANGDGRIDIAGADFNAADADDDGIMDIIDSGNGIGDTLSNLTNGSIYTAFPNNAIDTDGDGLPDYLDVDSDNDGIPDLIEAGGVDTDGDGRIDTPIDNDFDGWTDIYDGDYDAILSNGTDNPQGTGAAMGPLMVTTADLNADGTPGIAGSGGFSGGDFDGDLVPDFRDLDSDNDGVPDLIEVGGTDIDGNGIVDDFVDADDDGYDDNYDTDDDGIFGREDPITEPLVTTDSDGTGTDEDGRPTDNDNDGTAINGITADVDSDGQPDYKDLDADNDGIPDLIEMGGTDTDGNGIIDDFVDADGDGFDDTYVTNPLTTTDPEGTTDDGRPEDDDNDGTAVNGLTADVDMDGIPDSEDLDADNDGIPDLIEMGGTDTDGNGIIDDFVDADGDGFDDTYVTNPLTTTDPEGTTDDGRPEDDDNDGTTYNGVTVDVDMDGLPDSEDLDADNDGIPDLIEMGGTDTDGDGVIDDFVDADNDGFDDTYITNPLTTTDPEGTTDDGRPEDDDNDGTAVNGPTADVDMDGIPDSEDLDADNDGIPDLIEMGGTDTDGNGIIDDFVDADGDGFDDTYDGDDNTTPTANDGNGLPLVTTDPEGTTDDGRPEDDDNDGTTYNGVTVDVDMDGLPDSEDLDADNDGIPDLIEMGGTDTDGNGIIDDFVDADGDGFDDTYVTNPLTTTDPEGTTDDGRPEDDDNDGTTYNGVTVDVDMDGLPDSEDLDADNDGIPDLIEMGGTDTDGNGIIDDFVDADGDGFDDTYVNNPLTTTDPEGTTNDGRPEDDDNDGTAVNGPTADVDMDGLPDSEDLDADNDGIPDLIEMGGTDTDGDGIIDDFVDADGDGFDDTYVNNPLTTTDPEGTTDDGRPEDDDNDGTAVNGPTADVDMDGLPDSEDLDADNDGIPDLIEMGGTDVDGDGIIDDFNDTDGDGFDDTYDGDDNTTPTDNDGGDPLVTTDPEGTTDDGRPEDDDNDGTPYNGDTADFDSDGIPDSEDLDTDNDGIPDLIEMGGTDTDGDGRIDDFNDTDGDGFDDTYDGDDNTTPTDNDGGDPLVTTDPEGTTDDGRPEDDDNDGTPYNGDTVDVDQDGTPDNEDLDADNDGIPDLIEIGGEDTDNNGIVDNFTDADNDGFNDANDPTQGGTPDVTTDPEGTTDDGRPEDDDGNGTPYDSNAVDSDMDGIPDSEDLDSDDDGIADIVENGQGDLDTDNDGTIDPDDANYADTDGDGIADPVDEDPTNYGDDQPALVDTDQDGNPDLTDIDSDGDGIPDVDEIGLGNLDTDDDGRIDEPDADNDGITDTADNNDDDADDQDFGGVTAPTTNDHLVRSIRLACVNPLTEEVTIKNFGTVAWDISDYRLCSKTTYTTDLTSQTLVDGSFTLAPDATVTVKLTEISLDDVAADLGLYINGTTNFADSVSMQDFTQWGAGQQGRESVAVAKGIWEVNTYISPNEKPEYCYVGDGAEDGAVEWKGHLIAPLTDEGETQSICADTTWTVNHPITATNCDGTLTGTATGAGGMYTINPTTGCIDYTAPVDPTVLVDSVCIVICDTANVCDTSYAVFPIDTSDIQYPTFPLDPSETTTVCVDTSWQIRSPMSATDCDGNAGNTTAIGGVYTIDPLTNCVTYTAPANFVAHHDTVCVITCDGFNICDTSIVVFPIDSTDIAFPPSSVDPTDMPTVCVDTSWISGGPLTATDCNGQNSGNAAANGGAYTIDPVTGCVDYTFPTAPLLTSHDTVCVVLCDVNGVCDTSIIVFPLDTVDVAMPIIPVTPGDTSMVCVDMDWVTSQPIVATDCDGQPVGMAAGVMGDYTVDANTGCITYIAPPSMIDVAGDTVCIILCDANDVCDTSTVIFLFDMDGDMIADIDDLDDDNDGIPDAIEGMVDTDGDGIYDLWDLDSDNDGIQDVIEAGGVDSNGDGRLDINGTDWSAADLDNDGLLDMVDSGSGPNDTLSNLTNGSIYTDYPNGPIDTDGDGISDFRDVDSDNDGITDIIEAGGADQNGDGRVDVFVDNDADGWSNYYDGDNDVLLTNGIDNPQDLTNGTGPLMTTVPDINGDGTSGTNGDGGFNGGDFDGDTVPDFRDLDSDNDGQPDLIEVGGTDTDGDGMVDDFNDADGDGYDDNYDTDDDGILGVEDPLTEPLVTTDRDGSGTDENGRPTDDDNDGTIYNGITVDIDGDGNADHLDLDADNDGTPDIIEAGGTDEDGDGQIDNFNDADGDGFDDSYDPNNNSTNTPNDGTGEPLISTDPEGSTDDGRPEDNDNDGSSYNGATADVDMDGIPDSEDLDSDNDGIPDLIEMGGTDINGDGVIDDFQDDDGDGFDDTYDSDDNRTPTDNDGGTPLVTTDPEGTTDDGRPEDDDNDGTAINGVTADIDMDGIMDSEDLDADNDGIPDLIEVGGTDVDGDGMIDDFNDADGDGFGDTYDGDDNTTTTPNDGGSPLVTTDPEGTTDDGRPEDNDNDGSPYDNVAGADTDQDGVLDSEDLDTDNDGTPDIIETGGTDADGDGQIDNFNDADADGFDDSYDPNDNTTPGKDDGAGDPLVTTDPEGTTDDGRPEDTNDDGTTYNGATVDVDMDGVPDMEDLDSDNDGIPDLIETGGTDEDGNGIIDDFNDTDGDGFDDTYSPEIGGTPLIWTDVEGTIDDGRPEDTDNNDTTINGPTADVDMDGIPDSEDLDADNDGTPDLIEMGGTDVNGDGVIDDFNDPDGDGFDDTYSPTNGGSPLVTTDPEGTTDDGRPEDNDNDGSPYDNVAGADSDLDGILDSEDLDTDNDGIPDLIENGGTDADGDGRVDNPIDNDNDGFDDRYDSNDNTTTTPDDGAGTPLVTTDPEGTVNDGRPEDDDNDGTVYNGETVDVDMDGIPDMEDLDSDNDGTPDLIEVGGTDEDGNGIIDNFNDADNDGKDDTYCPSAGGTPLITTDPEGTTNDGRPEDDDNDGSAYNGPTADVDNDGVPDSEDLDADNDGIPDLIETGGTDADGDGQIDNFNDADGDGFDDTYSPEIGGTPLIWTDVEGAIDDGRPEDDDNDGTSINGPTADVDMDGIPDSEDVDADNDGIPDLIEVGGTDVDGDGRIDAFNDTDGDGFDDTYSPEIGGTPLVWTDFDGVIDDGRPEDDDADGTVFNGGPSVDTDGDGVIDSEDLDSDNDGIPDLIEVGGTDTNGDGQIDDLMDTDGDGFDDSYDPTDGGNPLVSTDPEGTTDDGRPEDTDNDGTVYNGETVDVDSDGIPDFEDLDADNDGIPDLIEMGGTDEDGDGIIDNFNDTDGDGFDDTYSPEIGGTPLIWTDFEGAIDDGRPEDDDNDGTPINGPTADVDQDGIPDSEDLDADNDGIPDLIEVGGTDTDGDGVIDDFQDDDGDGFDDTYDADDNTTPTDNDGGTPLITTDTEGTTDDGRPEDDDNNGTPYNGATVDMDQDGIPDNEDLDADNDGIPDLVEVGGVDEDGDGGVDNFTDTDGDGFSDTYDNNGTPMIWTDSEGTTDDGRPEDMNNDGTTYVGDIADTDMDGVPNSEDLDSDNDSVPDIVESSNEHHDTNNNGILDAGDEGFADDDNDGVINTVDASPSSWGDSNPPIEDIDQDGIPNFIDLESDGDGINDLDEANNTPLDLNGDGVLDDPSDMDYDGIADSIDANDDDPDNEDLGGLSNPVDDDWEEAGAPEILDPCNCLNNESAFGAGDGQFSEEVRITSLAGETWTITAVAGFYQNPTAPVFPPATGATGPYPQVPYTVGTVFTETPTADGKSYYTLQGIHVDAIGYTLIASNGFQSLNIGHTCNYTASCRATLNTNDPDATPGAPVVDPLAHIFLIPTDNVPRRDTMKSCDAGKNVFTDDGLVDGLYGDDSVRNNVLTICPTTRWQTVMVTFTDFDLAAGDVLNVYEGTGTNAADQIAVMQGTGVSQANGGWVMAHCDPDTNATGCLTFQFRTNGDLNKGRGWSANVTCNDRNIQLTPPNDLVATLACEQSYAILDIKPATINSNCGVAVQDSQIVRVFNTLGKLCLDTCLASTDVVKDTFGLGAYRVEYKLKSDTTKTTQGIMSVQGASLVCNDKINVPLGSSCAIALTPDDLLESTCDTITDTVYYFITLKGLDKNGQEVVLATGGGKGGNYPMVTKDMIEQCGGTITATIEKRFYDGLDLSFCNNGPQGASCSVEVNVLDQSAPTFTSGTTRDTFRLCSVDLTAETLGLPTPTAIDNCDSVKVEFMGATILNEGGACDTTRALLNWSATDACGNVATLAQSVVILRPDAADIVQAPDRILSCGEDDETALNDFAKTGMPRIKIGKVVNGVLLPTDTIALDTANYVCGYILQKRDVRVPADCGIKVFRYWDVLDWCDTQDGIMPIDTQYLELRDTLAPAFVATELPTINLALPHDACTSDITKLAVPAATDNCSTPNVTMAKVFRIEDGTKWEIPTEELIALNADSFEVLWVAADDCHEQTKTASLTQLVIIEDQTKPTAICTDKINLSLGRSEASLHYREIDAGSNDACGIVKYEVSKDEVNWDSTVVFTCEEAHTAVKVFLRVTDVNGNDNTCWTLVNVEDKIAPICSDLPTMTGSCDEGHSNGLAATDVNDNGQMDEAEWIDLTPEQAADFNAKYGDPNCSDNVTCGELVIQQQYQKIEKGCGLATIKRQFRAIDWDGEGMTSNWSEQIINIESKADWSITLPADWQGACGETIPTSELTIVNGACDLLSYEVDEKVFTTVEDACLKVVRTFTIVNLCTYQAGSETVTISRVENEHGAVSTEKIITSSNFEKIGKLEYVQILKLKDDTAPVIMVDDVDTCLDGEDCGASKRFAVTATDCNELSTANLVYNWVLSTSGTELAKGEGNFFNYPVAPKVTYNVRWTVADNCGNTAWKDVPYEFWDCKKPAPYCLHGIAVDLMEEVGMIQIWAKDLDINSSDNCTPKDRLTFKIWHEALGDAPTDDAGVQALPAVITLNCAYLGNQSVNLYIIDEEGNWDYCNTYVNVQDNTNACEGEVLPNEDMALVSGTIMDWKANNTVEGVKVFNAGTNSAVGSMETAADGYYNFELAMYDNYTITPEKYDNPLNGVSTFDLVLITKHILGQQEMTNPYQLIAADVNNSKTITAFDMVLTRKLILAIDDNFSNNTSWRFVEAGYEFTTENPLTEDFPEMATITDLTHDMEMDFVAVKIGDVNGNARTNSLAQAEDRNTKAVFEIQTEDKALKVGETYSLTFSTTQLPAIQGYQFTLGYDNLKISKLKTGIAGVENFGLHKMDKGMITTSWNQPLAVSNSNQQDANPQPATRNSQLFTIEFTAQTNGKLSKQLSLLDRPTAIEAYNQSGELMDVQLTFTKPSDAEQFDLFQNQPNPFHDKTMIGFYLPGDSEVQLILRDETGRVLKTIKENRKAGRNTIQLDKEELTNGFIYYQLSSKFGTKVKKMIKLQ